MNRNWQRNLVLVAQRLIQIGKPGLRTVVDHARGEAEAERDKLRKILGQMLVSADAAWEENNEGHDWALACETARAALSETEQPE